MKKLLLTSAMMMASMLTFAQGEVPPFYHTFEEEGSGDLWLSQDKNSIVATCVGNPLKAGKNTSDVVLQLEKYDAQWPGVQYTLNSPLNFGPVEDVQYAFVGLKLLNTADTELRFKFYDAEATEYVYDKPLNASSEWQEYRFFIGECTSYAGVPIDCNIVKLGIVPRIAGTIYLDDIYVSITENIEAPTGIDLVRNDNGQNGHAYYNLQGQRIDNPSKGLYVVGGKKVILK